jgi:hypothetical protein
LLPTKDPPVTYASATDDHREALHKKYTEDFELCRLRGVNALEVLLPAHTRTQNVALLKPSTIRLRSQPPAPALRVAQTRRGADAEAVGDYGAKATRIHSWSRNPDEKGRIGYEAKWEDDAALTWEPAEVFAGRGKEIPEAIQAADEELWPE